MSPFRTVLAGVAGIVVALAVVVALTPGQSPVLPLEVGVVLAVLTTWVALRRSRLSFAAIGTVALGLLALGLHIVVGDLSGGSGARELGPDVVVLLAAVVMAAGAAAGLRRDPATA